MPSESKKRVASKSKSVVVVFEFERDTKNTRRFKEVVSDDSTPLIGTLYLQKSAFKGKMPEDISVSITSI